MKKKISFILLITFFMLLISGCDNKVVVSFDYNCHGEDIFNCSVLDKKLNCVLITPKCENQEFEAWYDAKEGGNKLDLDADYNKSMTAYARFKNEGEITLDEIEEIKKEDKKTSGNSFRATLNCNGAADCKTTTLKVEYGKKMPSISSKVPTKEGYTFMGWYDNSDYTKGKMYYNKKNESVLSYDFEGTIILYAGWSKNAEDNKYTVTFNCNKGNNCSKSSIEAEYGKKMPSIGNVVPNRNGYIFMGWFDNSDYTKGKIYYNSKNESVTNYNLTSTTTLYAGWKQNIDVKKYNVSFNCNGGSNCPNSSVQATYGEILPTINAIPSRSGYIFMGWFDNSDWSKGEQYYSDKSKPVKKYLNNSNITLYAGWNKTKINDKYSISFNCNGGTNCDVSSVTATYNVEMPSISKTIPTKTGYTFMGWYDNKDYTKGNKYYNDKNESVIKYNKTSNITLYAGFKAKKYSVTFNCNGGNNCTTSNSEVEYNSNMPSISSTVPTKTGYVFMGWYDNSDYTKGNKYYNDKNESVIKYNKTSNITLYAGFKNQKYTVSFNCNSGSNCTTSSVQAEYAKAMPSISSTIPSRSGYIFMGWFDNSDYTKGKKYYDENNKSSNSYDKSSNTTLYAGWREAIFTLTFNCNSGSNCTTSSIQVENGKDMPAINSDIPIRDGYKFMGWYDNKDYNKGTQYYNDKNKSSRKYNKSKNITLYAGWRENLRIYFISLGRYDGFLIKGNGTTLFIDGGYEKQGDSCVAFVQSLGITKIDGLIGSHLHDNHIKAHLSFLKKMEVGRAYYGDELTTCVERKTCRRSRTNTDELVALLNEKNVPITYLEPGLDVKIGNLTFDILAPEVGTFVTTGDYPENRNSLNMVLKFGNHKFLFTGDYARDSEMLKNYPSQVENIDIFKWPHHGQEVVKNSLIDAMKPKYIIVPNENISDRNYAADGISRAKKYDRYIKSYYLGSKGYVLAESDGETLTVTKFSKR